MYPEGEKLISKGTPISPGTVLAPAFVVAPMPVFSDEKREFHTPKARQVAAVQNAISRLSSFYIDAANNYYAVGNKTNGDLMLVHNAILHDEPLLDEITRQIHDDYALESAVLRAFNKHALLLSQLDSEYFNQRASDLNDVATRLICAILGQKFPDVPTMGEARVLIGQDIPPSVLAKIPQGQVAGVVLAGGGKTSHSAIIAAGLGVPAVAGCQDAVSKIKDGETVFLDGQKGELQFNLSRDEIERFSLEIEKNSRLASALNAMAQKETRTADGVLIDLSANGQSLSSCRDAMKSGCDGIGLFRTEYLFYDRKTPPTEDEQFALYKETVLAMNGRPVTFRTLDMGGDKIIPCFPAEEESNPFLGLRAIRMYLGREDVFTPQIRAILRASAYGRVRVMFPMISNLEEFLSAAGHIHTIQKELSRQGIDFDPDIAVGSMIEVPSAAINADILAANADFISIGTNDLTQYTLAVDRLNVAVSYLYNHFDPAVLRLIHRALQQADKQKKPCSLCGEMASDPLAIPVLLGLGLRSFSVSPAAILRTRKLISLCRIDSCEDLARQVLASSSAKEVSEHIGRWIFPEFARWIA